LDIVHSLEENDVSPIIHKENGFRNPNEKKYRNNSIMGVIIPDIMFYSIIVGMVIYVGKIVLIMLKIIPKTSAESCLFWSLLEKMTGTQIP
jgi:ABC-type bacteriocin/lantibiotic exporter with double-glycine peptidase domain